MRFSTIRSTALVLALGFTLSLSAQEALDMTLLGSWDVDTLPATGTNQYNECWGYADCSGREYALIGSAAYLHFLDLQDPSNPQEIASFAGGNTTVWRDMKTFQDRAYSVCDNCSEGLMIFDLSYLPDSVVMTNQTTAFFGKSHNIFIDAGTGKLYAAGTNTQSDGLVILDLNADLDQPVEVAKVPLPGGYVHDLYAINDTLYCFHGGAGLYVYDVSDPTAPALLGSLTQYPESGYNHSGWLTEDRQRLVFADESFNRGLKYADVQDPSDIEVTDVFRSALLAPADTTSIAHNPLIRGQYAFVSYYHDGIQVFDLSDPENVQRVAYFDTEPNNTSYTGFTGAWGVFPFLPSGLILGSDMHHGLFVLQTDNLLLAPSEWPKYADSELQLSADPQLCEGESLVLTAASGNYQYNWYEVDSPDIIGSMSSQSVASPGNYYSTIQDAYCLISSDTVLVSVQALPDATITGAATTILCEGEGITLSAMPNLSYQWLQDGTPIPGATDQSYEVTTGGSYAVVVQSGDCSNESEAIDFEFLTATPPNLSLLDGQLIADGSLTYNWYFNGTELTDVQGNAYTPVEEGDYYVVGTDVNGCTAVSNTVTFLVDALSVLRFDTDWRVYPNPFSSSFTIQGLSLSGTYRLTLSTPQGQIVLDQQCYFSPNKPMEFSTVSLPAGLYILQLSSAEQLLVREVVCGLAE